MTNPDAQLYDRRIHRYNEQNPKADSLDYEEFLEVYSIAREGIYKANEFLFELDLMAEKKFESKMDTLEFDRMRRAIDKAAEKLQRATEYFREARHFLSKMEAIGLLSDNNNISQVTDEQLAHFIIKRSQEKPRDN